MQRRRQQQRTTVTISDVASRVGVATSTVSRALTNPGRVSEATRRRVLEAASELGYHPNRQARSLSSGKTSAMALIVPDVTNPFFFDLIRGAQHQARAHDYRLLLIDTEESGEVEALRLAEASSYVDGVVIAASRLSDEELLKASSQTPMVVINRDIAKLPCVIIDAPMGMVQALHHLVSLGHTSVAYLSGPRSSWQNHGRWLTLVETARELNVECQEIGPFSPTLQAGAAAADAAAHCGATACLFFNDLLAIGALQRFAERGIRIPEDMSVVGCDNIFGADFCHPRLTTLAAPIQQAGQVATDMLLSQLQTRGANVPITRLRETLSTFLTIRDSTGPARD